MFRSLSYALLGACLATGAALLIPPAKARPERPVAPPPRLVQDGPPADEPMPARPGGPDYSIPPGELIPTALEHLPAEVDVADWGHLSIDVPGAWKVTKGKGATVAVLDTGCDLAHPDLKEQIASSKNFTGSRNGAADVQGHGCVLSTDMIYTTISGLDTAENVFRLAAGPRVPDDVAEIKDVRAAGVYTLSADPKTGKPVRAQVQAVHKLKHTGRMFKVTTREGTVTLTPWHPVYLISSQRGSDLTITKKRADQIVAGDRVLLSGITPDVCIPQFVNGKAVDEDAAHWLGLVSSDGHLMKQQKAVSFSNTDPQQGGEYSRLCSSLFGKPPAVYRRPGRPVADWRLFQCEAWEFAAACGVPVGDKSATIRVPEVIRRSPRAVVMAYVAGLLEGDGCVKDRIRLATGSKAFAEDLALLMKTLGVHSFVSEVAPSKSTRPSYDVRIGADPMLTARLRVKCADRCSTPKPRVSASVVAVETIDHDDYVYDLTVADTHVYACNGHIVSNTHCAGIVLAAENSAGMIGVAPQAKLLVGKVLGDNGSGSSTWIAAGIDWAVEQGADVISMSLGGPSPDGATRAAVQRALARGVIVVAAAGNEGPAEGTVGYPGGYPECVCVAATDQQLRTATFSSRGGAVRVAAPGVNVRSCYPGGRFATMSGTSMATPYVAGCAALYVSAKKQRGEKPDPAEFSKLVAESRDLPPTGRDTATGYGLVQPAKLVGTPTVPPVVPPPVIPPPVIPPVPTPDRVELVLPGFTVGGRPVSRVVIELGPVPKLLP